jgi:hypothetical protein
MILRLGSCFATGGSAVVDLLPYHPKVKGSSLAATAGTGKEKMANLKLIKSILDLINIINYELKFNYRCN